MALPRPTRINTTETMTGKLTHDFRPSDFFRFEPKDDITIEELGYLISIFWTLDVDQKRFLEFGKDLQRHFQPIKS